MDRTLRQHAAQILADLSLDIIMVDVGAALGGVPELPSLTDHLICYGFEPNPDEYAKLLRSQKGEASPSSRSNGRRHVKQATYLPYGIDSFCGCQQLYVTRKASASSTLRANMERLAWYRDASWGNFAAQCEVVKTLMIEVKTLEQWAGENHIPYIDYLKVDAESKSYEVLLGAASLLRQTGLIKAEVEFIEVRQQQKLFSDVDVLLRAHGFELLNYESGTWHLRFKERTVPAGLRIFADREGQKLWGDAIYVNRHTPAGGRAVAQALVLAEKGYLDEATFILKQKTDVPHRYPAFIDALRTHRDSVVVGALDFATRALVWLYRRVSTKRWYI